MECVRRFERKRVQNAIRFASEDFNMEFQPQDNDFIVHYLKDSERVNTSVRKIVKHARKIRFIQ